MSWGENPSEDPYKEIIEETVMSECSLSGFSIALGKSVFDVDFSKKIKVEMLDPSVTINTILNIQFTNLTIQSIKTPFFWMSADYGFIGILIKDSLPSQIDWMKDQLASIEAQVDIIIKGFYFYHGTQIGLLRQGYFIPYIHFV